MALTIAGNIMLISIHLRGPRFLGIFLLAMGAQPALYAPLHLLSTEY